MRSDFNDYHGSYVCVFLKAMVNVHANIMQSASGQCLSAPYSAKPRGVYTGERLERDRPEVYAEIVQLLACGTRLNWIARYCRVSRHTIRAVRERDAVSIAQVQLRLAFKSSLIAEAAMDRIREALEADKVPLKLLIMIANKSTDMFLKLTRDMPPPVQPFYEIPCQPVQPIAGLPLGPANANSNALPNGETAQDTGAETHLLAEKNP